MKARSIGRRTALGTVVALAALLACVGIARADSVSEPGTWVLVAAGMVGLVAWGVRAAV